MEKNFKNFKFWNGLIITIAIDVINDPCHDMLKKGPEVQDVTIKNMRECIAWNYSEV